MAYIYGPKGRLGFIRNDEFYHVVSDHELSIRLVVKNGEVIAAFDYMPYGILIRHCGTKEAQIRYQFTGQEWDEELQLYDPSIGRFYQVRIICFFNLAYFSTDFYVRWMPRNNMLHHISMQVICQCVCSIQMEI